MSVLLKDLNGSSIFDSMSNPVLVMDKEGIIIYVNNFFEKTFGLDSSSIIGNHFLSLSSFTENILDTETAKKKFKQFLKTKSIPTSEFVLKDKNGENKSFALDVMRLQGENGKTSYIAVVMMDITDSKRVQNELLKAQEELRLVLDSVPAGIWYKDSKNNFIRVNAAAAATVSLKPEDIEGKSTYDLFPELAEEYYKEDLKVLQSGRPKTGIIEPLHSKSGEMSWVETDKLPMFDEAGKVTGLIVIKSDITSRVKAEQELLKAQDELRLVLDSVPAGIWYKDSKNNFIRVNAAAAASVNMKPEDIEGKSAYELFPDQAEQYYKDDLEVLQSGRPKTGIIEPLYLKSGEMLWVETDKLPMFDDAGKVTGLLVIVSDISSRVKAEQELLKAQDELIRNERLSTLGKFTGSVGHELRNPLTSIKNASYFLNMAIESPDPDIKDTLDILSKEVANCERIIDSLLDYARPRVPTIQKVLIREIIDGILSTVQIPNSIKVDTKFDDNLVFLLGDRHQLERAFTNLIMNAVQAMPNGGQLSISAGKNKNSSIRITIADTGVGISKENMKHLFEPLYTTKATGIGLGLVIVKSLIDAHEGIIEVKSKEQEGSQFIVTLPLHDGG